MSGELVVEATGETVGEAKGNALRELEQLAPALDRAAVRFQVLSEGTRGLLGVGFEPARVLATTDRPGPDAVGGDGSDESEAGVRLRALLSRATSAFGVQCRIEIAETESTLVGTCVGEDLGLLIGRHGQTIDALQLLAGTIVGRSLDERKQVIVDAAGYRDRRRRTLEALALRSADDARRTGGRIELDAMSAAERRLVHECLKEHPGVTTSSEGDEPYRHVVVEPA